MDIKKEDGTSKSNKKGEFVRFLIVGTVATVILYGIYYPLCDLLNPSVAYSIGFIFSFVANFFLTSIYTFRSRPTWKKGLGFSLQQGVNYLFQLGFLNLFLWMKVPKEIAPIPVFFVILPINFILLRLVFKKKVF
ncbi:MAG: GtrA family protein [Bacteroidales bacterium]